MCERVCVYVCVSARASVCVYVHVCVCVCVYLKARDSIAHLPLVRTLDDLSRFFLVAGTCFVCVVCVCKFECVCVYEFCTSFVCFF